MTDHIVIGAGISGLVCAYELKRAGKNVVLIEAAPKAGGKILSERKDGYLLEGGPNSLRVEDGYLTELIASLRLTDRVLQASAQSKARFILKAGLPVSTPASPMSAINSPLLSFGGKIRAVKERFVAPATSADEAVSDFIERRFGKEVHDTLADPFVSGIYAGDASKLSMRHAMPKLWEIEQLHGSLIKGAMKNRKKNGKRPSVISFPNGLAELVEALTKSLGQSLHLNEGVSKITYQPGKFSVSTIRGTQSAPSLIIATPAVAASTLIGAMDQPAAQALNEIRYPAVNVAYIGYHTSQFERLPEGFGILIPTKEGRKILGIIFSSSLFPERAPKDHLLLTVLMGGAVNPWIERTTEKELLATAIGEVREILNAKGEPAFTHSRMWKRAIPQYELGYGDILTKIESAEAANPGLHLIGNYRGGIAVGACVRNATELAKRLV